MEAPLNLYTAERNILSLREYVYDILNPSNLSLICFCIAVILPVFVFCVLAHQGDTEHVLPSPNIPQLTRELEEHLRLPDEPPMDEGTPPQITVVRLNLPFAIKRGEEKIQQRKRPMLLRDADLAAITDFEGIERKEKQADVASLVFHSVVAFDNSPQSPTPLSKTEIKRGGVQLISPAVQSETFCARRRIRDRRAGRVQKTVSHKKAVILLKKFNIKNDVLNSSHRTATPEVWIGRSQKPPLLRQEPKLVRAIPFLGGLSASQLSNRSQISTTETDEIVSVSFSGGSASCSSLQIELQIQDKNSRDGI